MLLTLGRFLAPLEWIDPTNPCKGIHDIVNHIPNSCFYNKFVFITRHIKIYVEGAQFTSDLLQQ